MLSSGKLAPDRLWPWLIALVVAWVYHNSLTGPFIFDDPGSIINDPRITQPGWWWNALTGTDRPLTDWTFALNYALGGRAVRGYHLINLGVHLLASLTLFGLMRRTLLRRPARAPHAAALAGASSLLWAVHPLQTESVTYLVQRAELLAGLGTVLTLYALARSAHAPQPRRWHAAAILAGSLGLCAKPVAAVTPWLALSYDRVFLAGSWRAAWRQRRGCYLGLVAGWGVLAIILLASPGDYRSSAGFGLEGLSWWQYARTQPGVILHYVRLAIWPQPLVFDYLWPVAKHPMAIVPPSVVLLALLAGTWGLWRISPAAAFPAVWVWLTLAPSSSVIPIADRAAEHRMYLPLAGLVALVVVGVWRAVERLIEQPERRTKVAVGLVAAAATLFGSMTIRRNEDYRSELAIWIDTVAKRPESARAHNLLGNAFVHAGRDEAALHQYGEALRLKPDYAEAHNNLGAVLATRGAREAAMAEFRKALELDPAFAEGYYNLGVALAEQGALRQAASALTQALKLDPHYAQARQQLVEVLRRLGDSVRSP